MTVKDSTVTSEQLAALRCGAEVLEAVTGTSNRRHLQLVQEGYIPARVNGLWALGPVLTGLFKFYREHSRDTKDKLVGTKEDKTRKEVRLLEIKIAKEERRTIDRGEVNKLLLHVASQQRAVLFAALEREYPGKVVGRTASEISAHGRALADRLCDVFTREIEQWQTQD